MRAGPAILGFALLGVVTLKGAEVPIEFSGVLTANGKPKVALTDKSTQTTQWLDPGDAFLGYAIARYDPGEEAVFLRKNGEEIRLPLVTPKSTPAQPAAAAAPAPAANTEFVANAIRSNLRQFVAAARRVQAEQGTAQVSYADLVGPGKPLRELTPVAGENYTSLTYAPAVTALSVTTSAGNTVTLDVGAPPAALGALVGTAPAIPAAPAVPAAAAEANPTPAPPPPAGSAPAVSASPLPAEQPRVPDAGDALAPTGLSSYTIRPGDTLPNIARAHGVTVEQLQAMNPNLNASSLQTGQAIRIR
jgi:LysM repeat protein